MAVLPLTVRPELVEGLFCLRAESERQSLDRLGTNGVLP